MEGAEAIAEKPVAIEFLTGIGVGRAIEAGERDVAEMVVSLGPESGAPGLVQGIDRSIFFLQPFLESGETRRAITLAEVAEELVVGLPANHQRIIAKMAGHRARDADRFLLESGVIGAAVLAAAMHHGAPIIVHAHPVGMIFGQPARGRCRGSAEDGADAVLSEMSNRLIEK